MKIVIQCAASKQANAGYFLDRNGHKACFVANPALAPAATGCIYARPDDKANGSTWREMLDDYNLGKSNPYRLLPAGQLYCHPVYAALLSKFGINNVYILSACWGLLKADYLTPCYDITFSNSADAWKKRSKKAACDDFNQLPLDSRNELVFFGGKDYLPLFCQLTAGYRGKRKVFFNAKQAPDAPGCELVPYPTRTRTNWHYECAKWFLMNLGI